MIIAGNMVGSYSQIGKTFTFVDADGNEVLGVVTDKETILTATDEDVKKGKVYASDNGISVGTLEV
jgi:hypothetical protein